MAVSLAECDAMIEASARSKIKLLMDSKAGDQEAWGHVFVFLTFWIPERVF